MNKYDHCATEEYRVETEQPKRRCYWWPWLVVCVVVVVIVIAVTLAVIYTRTTSSTDYLKIDRVSLLGSVKVVDIGFSPGLNDSTSDEYLALETAFVLMMDYIFSQSKLANSYNATTVKYFRSGSVVVFFEVLINDSESIAASPITNHNQGIAKNHIRQVVNKTIHLHAREAASIVGIEIDVKSLIIHEVIWHHSDQALDEDDRMCDFQTEDEYVYLKEGEVMNVTSPCFPEVIDIERDLNRVFLVPDGHRVKISFSEFRFEEDAEFLYMGSSPEPDVVGTFIARFTGYQLPPTLVSAGPALWIRPWSYVDTVSGVFASTVTVIKDEEVDYGCEPGESPCKYAWACFAEEEQCDGHNKCPSGTDEIGCECYPPLSYYKCSDGRCLERQYVCNGPQACSDDEAYCNFTCPTGKNVTDMFICDGFNDCGDYADEKQNCACDQQYQWPCPDGTCIYENNVCDGFPHCPGGEDEVECRCQSWQFECGDGTCIPFWDRCDGNDTCGDNSDEQDCPKCPGKLYQCPSFQCIAQTARCDGSWDCFGQEDEQDCPSPAPCPEGEFSCGFGLCLRPSLVCDGTPQCINGTDEENCGDDEEGECDFRCSDGQCIVESWVCDGVEDCPEGDDEPDCEYEDITPCMDGFFQCPDRQCIRKELICNGIRDCQGNADEKNCSQNAKDLCHDFSESDYFVCDGKEDCPDGVDEQDCAECGKRPARDRRRRMLGGRETTAAEWPWQISLASQNDTEGFSCGGTVLNRRWILTAAHCISTYQIGVVVVITGVTNRLEPDEHVQLSHIADVYEHPDFYFSGHYLLFDAILVHLEEPLTMTDYVRPVCLPDVGLEIEPGTYLTSTGFGETGAGDISSVLMETRLPVIPSDVCVRWTEHDLEAVSKVICVGYEKGVQGPCFGDSGGPLVYEKDDSWYIVGIVSGGAECGAPYSPTFYTRVTELLHWIDDVINLR